MQRNSGAILTGLGLGVGLMYFLDPERGRRRRALVRDKIAHAATVSSSAMGSLGRDVSHRAAGVVARFRGALRQRPVDDDVLVERVRARLGRVVSHPHAIEVKASGGHVRLHGSVLESELPRLMQAVGGIRGVRAIEQTLQQLNVWQRG
jgi:osmotically-inducible protein OsmY